MGTEIERLTKLETEQHYIRDDVKEMKKDIKAIRETLSQARGGWKLLMMASGIAGSVGVLIGKMLMFMR